MLTVPEAAVRAGYSPETIRRWIRAGRLAASKVGTQHVIREEDLDAVTSRPSSASESPAPYVVEAWEDDRAWARALLKRIVLDPRILVGKPIIRGTRISVELVLDHLAGGWTNAQIIENYLITEEDIRACVAYAGELVREWRVYAFPAR